MKTNLNFKIDTPPKNGRIYPRNLLEGELKRKIEKNNLLISKESESLIFPQKNGYTVRLL
jgi:hypothetical protein